jgi:lycopene beta-cyclase
MLNEREYKDGLNDYLSAAIGLNENEFSVISEEVGMIPMTNYEYPASHNNIIYIGSAGGNTKASSGYTFRFIQKHSAQIVAALIKNNSPHVSVNGRRYNFYDSVLLKILIEKKLPGAFIFSQLFERNKMKEVFKFLDNETSLPEDIKLISALPKGKFISAAFSHLFQ